MYCTKLYLTMQSFYFLFFKMYSVAMLSVNFRAIKFISNIYAVKSHWAQHLEYRSFNRFLKNSTHENIITGPLEAASACTWSCDDVCASDLIFKWWHKEGRQVSTVQPFISESRYLHITVAFSEWRVYLGLQFELNKVLVLYQIWDCNLRY